MRLKRRRAHADSDTVARSRTRRDERGATMVILGISIVTLLFIVSLVVDGGRAYAARRTAQNASDAAAMAGAQALYKYKYQTFIGATGSALPSVTTIRTAVFDKLTQNRAVTGQTCDFVAANGALTGFSCESGNVTGASGVRVGGALTQKTAFAPQGAKLFTAKGAAVATIQPLIGTTAPFIVCGASDGSWPILDPVIEGQPVTINVANAYAAGVQPLQAAKVGTCGAGSAFKGKAEPDQEIVVGQYARGDNGNGYDTEIRDSVAGAVPCPPPPAETLDCDMLLPIADSGYGNGSGIYLRVQAFGIFHVTGDGHGNPKYYGQFVKPAKLAAGGVAGNGQQCNVGSSVCLVKLIA
jgi:Flp pilus assembly protein TadG